MNITDNEKKKLKAAVERAFIFGKTDEEKMDAIANVIDAFYDKRNQDDAMFFKDVETFTEHFYACFGITIEQIRKTNRNRNLVAIRNFYCYLLRSIFGGRYTLEEIAKFVNKRDHSTIIHSIDQITKKIEVEDTLVISLRNKWTFFKENLIKNLD